MTQKCIDGHANKCVERRRRISPARFAQPGYRRRVKRCHRTYPAIAAVPSIANAQATPLPRTLNSTTASVGHSASGLISLLENTRGRNIGRAVLLIWYDDGRGEIAILPAFGLSNGRDGTLGPSFDIYRQKPGPNESRSITTMPVNGLRLVIEGSLCCRASQTGSDRNHSFIRESQTWKPSSHSVPL